MRRPKKTVTINLADYLSAGTYNVKVKSKGTDIRDSADSNSVECVVAGGSYEVAITFQNGIQTQYWVATKIYENYTISNNTLSYSDNDKVGNVSSANGTATVTTTTGKLLVVCEVNYDAQEFGTITPSSGITKTGYWSPYGGNGGDLENVSVPNYGYLYCTFSVSSNGTIVFDGTDFND